MSACRSLALVLGLLLAAAPVAAQRPCDAAGHDSFGPSRDLYCMELVPAPGVAGVSGRIELAHVAGLFTIAVTADGRLRYRPILAIAGLPPAESLGHYHVFAAWITPPTMYPVVRLGEVRNGTTTLPVVDFEKFHVLVTAERGAKVKAPSGRMVLRGQSPSTRLFSPDLMEFSIGSMPMPGSTVHGHGDRRRELPGAAPSDSGTRWTTAPMPAGLTMLPAEMALRPDEPAYLPSGPAPAADPRT